MTFFEADPTSKPLKKVSNIIFMCQSNSKKKINFQLYL
ncbi:hypothetical protein LEP1GSC083_0341 [Leptospira interrogans serovar Pyrogenes str. L0374]|uniref:Uncharacterized protein n=4 Tax=Leptospira TaxID=171 RepID=M7ABK4_LEPIR|nr:hypothetical protein G436_1043 [Leptospira interrogans serovar Hardjo str. Norma]EJP03792.1 hypothetical protein LEP1GSC007_0487 [Leptospira interrogans serovar Bulgarica str. Mallika]EKO06876.1 hypothetical protein LEP1GSC077_4491 [Leptospira interrogans str. C10069]EKO17064.1 hypothetical protein LEP1GSC081_4004 [Leptospira kirschneri str. H1]EKO89146.1 hypothetical protein LEP1GSC009_4077 [Leptospira interrogans serovar Grippotyphosa str. Andaman]EKO96859.1 hypothetical protein LEP1GSC05